MTTSIIISLIVVVIALFTSIIGAYALIMKHMKNTSAAITAASKATSEELGKIYQLINTHIQNNGLHPEVDKVVAIAVCNEVQKRHEVLLDGVKRDVAGMSTKVDKLDSKLDSMANNLTKLVEKL
jgi:flagellar basal body-associated protein FliL